MFRFLHSSDLHLGKSFGGNLEGIRRRLREARHGAMARLPRVARDGGADTILLTGDAFDDETPAPKHCAVPLPGIAAEADVTWVLLPRNHDSVDARSFGGAWPETPYEPACPHDGRALRSGPGVKILPAPSTQRGPGRDPTKAMAAATPER